MPHRFARSFSRCARDFRRRCGQTVPELIDKDVLHVQLTYVPNGKLIDLGGGYSPISAVLARLGMDVTVVDTFASTKLYEQFSALGALRRPAILRCEIGQGGSARI